MTEKTYTFTRAELSNGALFVLALFKQGLDVADSDNSAIGLAWYQNIGFANASRLLRDNPTMKTNDMIDALTFEADCVEVFSAAYKQAKDKGLDGKAAAEYAKKAVATHRENRKGKQPTESSKPSKGINPLPAAKVTTGKNPGLIVGLTFKFEQGHYKVEKAQSGGLWRVKLTSGMNSLKKYEGQTVTIPGGLEIVVKKYGDSWVNVEQVNVPPATPAQTEQPTESTGDNDAALVAQVTAAVLAALKAQK